MSMDPMSRRSLLVRGGVGAAGVAAVGGGMLAVAPSAQASHLSPDELAKLDQPMMLRIHNAATGEVELFVGEREILITDKQLVAKLLRATR